MRIVLLGVAGAGKTRLAARLAAATGAPHICLDAIWRPAWTEADVPAFRAQLAELHAGEAWISDGAYAAATFDIRLPSADLIAWLEPPRPLCALRAITRVFRPGEPHRLARLPNVLRFIWRFDRVNRPRIEALRLEHGANVPVVRLRTARDLARFEAAQVAAPRP